MFWLFCICHTFHVNIIEKKKFAHMFSVFIWSSFSFQLRRLDRVAWKISLKINKIKQKIAHTYTQKRFSNIYIAWEKRAHIFTIKEYRHKRQQQLFDTWAHTHNKNHSNYLKCTVKIGTFNNFHIVRS